MAYSILFTGLMFVAVLLTMLFVWKNQITPKQITLLFTTFVMLQFWNMFNVKAFASGKSAFSMLRNCKIFLFIAACVLAGQVIIVEFGGKIFQTVPLQLIDWIKIIGGTGLVLLFGEFIRMASKLKIYKSLVN